jgi:hypothetical protein
MVFDNFLPRRIADVPIAQRPREQRVVRHIQRLPVLNGHIILTAVPKQRGAI